MEPNYIIIIIAMIAECVAIYFLVKNNAMFQLIKSTETSMIKHLRKGFYEIKGRVVALEPHLISPYSEKPCVYYNFKVEQKRSNGKSSHWAKILEDKKFQKFGVDDGTGIAAVDMQSAKIDLNMDRKDKSGIFNNATSHQQRVLKKYSKQSKGWLFEKTLRYEETFLEEGDEVFVIGEVVGSEQEYPIFNKTEKPFFVSDKREEALISLFQNRIYIAIAVMILCGVVAIYFI